MIRLPFPCKIEAQTRSVTLLTIKSVVRKIQKNDGQRGSCAWTKGGGVQLVRETQVQQCVGGPIWCQCQSPLCCLCSILLRGQSLRWMVEAACVL